MKYLFLSLGMFLSVYLSAQHRVEGTIVDQETPLIGATVVIITNQDSTMVAFGVSNDNGAFKVFDVPSGDYLAQISYTGYSNTFIPFSCLTDETIDLGRVELSPSTEILQEVNISAERIPMGILGDTISYNASAFQTREGATVEDLLKKLPGIDVQRDGSIKAYGEDVDQVLVDGKEFFNGDPTMATKNLEAEAVDKVQVFDKKSEEAEFTGVDDGEEQKTINIALKEDHKNGGFGRITAEGGTESRYKGKVNYNRFSPKSQASVIANANNMNQEVFSFNDYINFMGGLSQILQDGNMNTQGLFSMNQENQQGIDQAKALGINFNYFRSKKLNWSNNYMLINNRNDLQAESNADFYGQQIPFTSIDSTDAINRLSNHRLNSKLEYKVTPLQKILVQLNGGLRLNNLERFSQSQFLQNNSVINQTTNQLLTDGIQWEGVAKLNYIKKFEKKGRNLRFKNSYERTQAMEDNTLNNIWNSDNTQRLLQQEQIFANQIQAGQSSLKYMEPISKNGYLSAQISSSFNQQAPYRNFYDIADNLSVLNEDLSSDFERSWNIHTAGILLQRNKQKLKIFAGLDYSLTQLSAGTVTSESAIKKQKAYVLPNFKYTQRFKGSRKLETNYTTSVQAPSLRQLISIPNNLNPNILELGNSDLIPEYLHNVRLNYSDLNEFNFSNFFSSFNVQYSNNKIVYEREILSDLTAVRRAYQSPSFLALNAYLSYGSPIRKLKIKYDVSLNLQSQWYQTRLNQEENAVQSNSANLDVRVENRNKDQWDLALGFQSNFQYFNNSIDQALNQTFVTNSYYLDALYSYKDQWELGFTYDMQNVLGRTLGEPEGESLLLHLMHLEVKRILFKNKITLSARVHDLLNQNTGIFRSGDANALRYSRYNTLGRYMTLGVSYKIGNRKENSIF